MDLQSVTTVDLLKEIRRRCGMKPEAQWMKHKPFSIHDFDTWSDSHIAAACLHNRNAPKELIDLKREQLRLEAMACKLFGAAQLAKEDDETLTKHP